MPYGYYGNYASYGGVDLIYISLLIPVILLSLWAQSQVNGNFSRYGRVQNRRGLTGAQAAKSVLLANGVRNVRITYCSGKLTDHYDPRDNTIYLSESVYGSATVSAVGVAAHEAGHAVQYAQNYFPVRIRTAIIPITQFGSKFSFVALMLGIFLSINQLFLVGIILFSLTTIFQVITLPVEFNASRRALVSLDSERLLDEEELRGARKVLRAAALTYVAALLSSLVQLLRYVLIFLSRSDNRRGGRR